MVGEVSVFLLHEKEQSAGYWVEPGVRLYMQCGMVWKVMKTYPMSADAMRVVVPYKKSISATPKRRCELLKASKEAWERMQWYSSVEEESLGEDGLVNYRGMMVECKQV